MTIVDVIERTYKLKYLIFCKKKNTTFESETIWDCESFAVVRCARLHEVLRRPLGV